MSTKDDNMNKVFETRGMVAMMGNKLAIVACLIGALALTPTAMVLAETRVMAADYQIGIGGEVSITLSTEGDVPAVSVFETNDPARIVLDLSQTESAVDTGAVTVGAGAVRGYTLLSTGGQTRLVVDLSRTMAFDYDANDGAIVLTIEGGESRVASGDMGYRDTFALTDVDFRRGTNGQGRVIVGLDGAGFDYVADVGMGELVVEIFDTILPDRFDQLLDVVDFATPIQIIDLSSSGEKTVIKLSISGNFEHMAYQDGTDLVIEVAQVLETEDGDDLYSVTLFEDKEYEGTRVTFNFQDIAVRSVLQLIADVSDLNIVVADNVSGNLTLRLTNVPWDQALDIILDARNLDKRTNGNVIWIAPTADIAAREQELLQAMADRRELEPLVTRLIAVNYSDALEIKALIEESKGGASGGGDFQRASGILSDRGSISVDERTNTLVVSDTADRVEAVRALVAELDTPVDQVQIESRIVVANSDFSRDLGVRFGVSALHQGSNILAVSGNGDAADLLNPATNPRDDGLLDVAPIPDRYNVNLPAAARNAGAIGLSFLAGDYLLDLELSALETDGEGEVISTPRIVTANKEEAFIQQGVEIPYNEATSSGASASQFKEAVLELKVTPLITPDDRIQMELEIKQDTVGDVVPTGFGGSAISIDTRELKTSVLVRNSETVVLGGIFQDERSQNEERVPYLSSIPVVGALFRNRSNALRKRELLIFITPTIVEDRPTVD